MSSIQQNHTKSLLRCSKKKVKEDIPNYAVNNVSAERLAPFSAG